MKYLISKLTAASSYCLLVVFSINGSFAQPLTPGYNREELAEILSVSVRTGSGTRYFTDSNYVASPTRFKRTYSSPELGLMNKWELWTDGKSTAVITVRGTVPEPDSWLVNFYAAMIPAKGTIVLPGADTVNYQVADHPRAAVHVGWMISTAYLSRDIRPRLDSLFAKGYRQLYITGHSQGGGISYLLTAFLRQQQKKGELPAAWQMKTYSTAAPKPGNLFFAYDYEAATAGGWAMNVVNAADWVPELPITVQTVTDANDVNPFKGVDEMISKQKIPTRWAARYVYNRIEKPTRKAQRNFEKYLGKLLGKRVEEKLQGLQVPAFVHSSNYVRTGITVVLQPDADYYSRFPDSDKQIFVHHFHHPYIYLVKKELLEKPVTAVATPE
ncbi:MAG: lipase family protein [Bacteroidota bacterium]|jgi:hypothetical protein|nr:lipase family protein [Chitinophagaceae bacterium]